ncbi:polysaccharide deacetylase family sporulation protein PdaB [Thermoanaerobacter uzonensis DSM 18761]|jgi:polysaccharide deacetylase family sporulation protein PdaB|uniref:Polysaccharide deacetylase family sporulation protein PdaB n=1 Tax=Thermoanaerobacter uzonensis DSM 18761 TaxID=1123369 RepID=A0A1M4Z184_9THEO|nr:polysaccharide deacetylase family sporulation protein PdaB [Thermoanaerobacter uzonensis]SHF11829.1 polysaccharide deacetylase family sporulation protein PdaB [Thermoanaerobacter uzonensis DSM 18761]
MAPRRLRQKNRSIIYTLIIVFLMLVLIGSAAFAYKYMFEDRYVQVNSTTKIWNTPSDKEKSSSPLQQQPNTTKNQEKNNSKQTSSNQNSVNPNTTKDTKVSDTTNGPHEENISPQIDNLDKDYGISTFIFKLLNKSEIEKLFGPPIPFNKRVFGYNKSAGKVVALTFDDGPIPEYTEKYVDILKSMEVKATFFVIGKNAQKHPDLLKYIFENGNEIGLHSYSHFNMSKMKPEQMVEELYKTQKIVVESTGIKPTLFRPPYGAFNKTLLEISDALGLHVVLWNVDPDDWRNPAVESVVNRVISHTKNGSVILMHEGKINTLAALPLIIEKLKSEGYSFVTVSELLNYEKNNNIANSNQEQQKD